MSKEVQEVRHAYPGPQTFRCKRILGGKLKASQNDVSRSDHDISTESDVSGILFQAYIIIMLSS